VKTRKPDQDTTTWLNSKKSPLTPRAGEKLLNWVDNRFPASKLYKEHLSEYYAPKNFNFWYFFGSLATAGAGDPDRDRHLLGHALQARRHAWLLPRSSTSCVMCPWGWLIRYMHSTGASAFFIVVYMHMFRGLIYGSYRKPRELVWVFGCAIFLCLMAEAFMGYLLPWGQMSYWGAQVIVNLFAAVPLSGPDLALLIRGDYVVSDATLNRFFSFHVIAVPLVFCWALVVAHIIALHEVGSNNPDGVEIKGPNAPKDAHGHPLDGHSISPLLHGARHLGA
jgi:ubiquinol-cytochrome c reductase cytochrome b subunit